jgi:hypothetical protein
MNRELLESLEGEVLGWPGVVRERGGGITVYRYGRRQIGHVHHDGVADLPFPREVHERLVSEGRAEPHRGGFRGVVSYRLRSAEDVPGAVALFRMGYERARAAAERRAKQEEIRRREDTAP